MIRVTVDETNDKVTLLVEGKLCSVWVKELERVASEVRGDVKRKAMEVDVSGVSAMDAAGKSLIGRFRNTGIRVRNLDPLSESLVAMHLAEVGITA